MENTNEKISFGSKHPNFKFLIFNPDPNAVRFET